METVWTPDKGQLRILRSLHCSQTRWDAAGSSPSVLTDPDCHVPSAELAGVLRSDQEGFVVRPRIMSPVFYD